MPSIKTFAGIGVIAVSVSMLLAIAVQEYHTMPLPVQNEIRVAGSPGVEGVAREEFDSLANQVASLRQAIDALSQDRTGVSEKAGDLREQVVSLQDQVSDIASRVDIERSNPLDTRAVEAGNGQPTDEAEQPYLTAQYRDEADSEFRMQEYDPQWAVATENRIRESLAFAGNSALPGADVDMTSLIDSLECRSESCRIEIRGAGNENPETIQMQLLASTAGLFSSGTVHQTDSGGTVIYMHVGP